MSRSRSRLVRTTWYHIRVFEVQLTTVEEEPFVFTADDTHRKRQNISWRICKINIFKKLLREVTSGFGKWLCLVETIDKQMLCLAQTAEGRSPISESDKHLYLNWTLTRYVSGFRFLKTTFLKGRLWT